MARIYSWDWCLLRGLCNGFLCCLAVQHRDTRARLQLVLSVDHDLLIGLEAGINEGLAAADLRDLDRPALDRALGIDDIDVGAVRALLHSRCSDGEAIMYRIDEQPRVDELARPEPARFVDKIRLELDRARCLQDLVVDEAEYALVQQGRVVLAVGENRERGLGLLLLLLDLRQIRFRESEDQLNRIDLRDDDEAVRT